MADDVKVKFGGDFSDLSKGASSAAQKAGTTIASSLTNQVVGIGTAIAGFFTITSIASKIWEGFKEGISYLHDLNLAMTRTGQSSAEFQKLAYSGKEAGVSMDIVGRALTEANKQLAKAQTSKSTRDMFTSFGMDADRLQKGTYTATEALLALADGWDKFGNDVKTRASAVAVFGRFGEGMIPIIKQGRQAIEEQTASVNEQTRAEILGAAAIEKKLKALERYAEQVKRTTAAAAGAQDVRSDYDVEVAEVKKMKRNAPDKYSDEFGDKTAFEAAAQRLAKKYREKYGINAEEMSSIFSGEGVDKKVQKAFKDISDEYVAERDKEKPKGPELAGVLSASSLQAIGGGDVASVLSGTYQADMLETTRQIAENTKPKETAHDVAPVARAGK